MTWFLHRRSTDANSARLDEVEVKKQFGPNAQLLSSPRSGGPKQDFCCDDLPQALQNVLRVQLGQPGNVSAVIELPDSFTVYLLLDQASTALKVAVLSLPKRSYAEWLAEQPDPIP